LHRDDFHRLVAWCHAAAAFGVLFGICAPHGASVTALAALVAGLLYAGSALFIVRRRSEAHGAVIEFAVAAASFLAIAIVLEYDSFVVVCLWTLEAFVLVLLGTQGRRRYLSIIGLILLGVTAVTLLGLEGSLAAASPEHQTPVVNLRAFTFVLLAAAGGLAAHLLRRTTSGVSMTVSDTLHVGWMFLIFVLLTVETNDLFRSWMIHGNERTTSSLSFARLMVMAAVWSLYGLLLVWSARHIEIAPLVFCGVSATVAAACLVGIRGIVFESPEDFTPAFNVRVYALLCVAGAVLLEHRWLKHSRVRSGWIPELQEAMLIVGIALLLVLCTGETRDAYEQAIAVARQAGPEGGTADAADLAILEESSRLENLKQLSLSGVWLLFSIGVMSLGIWRRTRILRLLAIALFAVTILKIFIYDLSFLETLYRIFSFIGLGLMLLAVSYLYQRYRDVIIGSSEAGDPEGPG
jgi:uncharacterized membrane protein